MLLSPALRSAARRRFEGAAAEVCSSAAETAAARSIPLFISVVKRGGRKGLGGLLQCKAPSHCFLHLVICVGSASRLFMVSETIPPQR